jgi:3-methyladenine DNA glycosylase AlkD
LGIPLSVCQFHISNKQHYIQKACGWVLREIGKTNRDLLDQFLIKNISSIHSICLSYALEKHTKYEEQAIKAQRFV